MLLQVSYYSKEKEERINELVGKPFGLIRRIKMGGIGSQKMNVLDANREITELLKSQTGIHYTNIELRSGGLILWFRIKQDSWVLAMPFYKLSFYKTGQVLILYCDHWKVRMQPAFNAQLDVRFVKKLLDLKADYYLNFSKCLNEQCKSTKDN